MVKEGFDNNKLNWTINRTDGLVPEIRDGVCRINTQDHKKVANVIYPNKDLAITNFDLLKIRTRFKTSNIENAIGIACVSKNGEPTSALSFLLDSEGYAQIGEIIDSMQRYYFDEATFSEKLNPNQWIDLTVLIDNKKSIIDFFVNSKKIKTTSINEKVVSRIDNIGFLIRGEQAVEIDFFEVEKKEGINGDKTDFFLTMNRFLIQRNSLNNKIPIDVVDMVEITAGQIIDAQDFLVETLIDTEGIEFIKKEVSKNLGTIFFFSYQGRNFELMFSIPDESKSEANKDLVTFSITFDNKADAKKFVEDFASYLGWIADDGADGFTDGYHHPKSTSTRIWVKDNGLVMCIF